MKSVEMFTPGETKIKLSLVQPLVYNIIINRYFNFTLMTKNGKSCESTLIRT